MTAAVGGKFQTPEITSRGLTDVVFFKKEAEARKKETVRQGK